MIIVGSIVTSLVSLHFLERPSSSAARRLLGLRSSREERARAEDVRQDIARAELPPVG